MHKRCDFLRKFCFVLVLFLCVNLGHAKLEIIVKSSPNWGPIADADVEYLCQEIVDRFEEHLRPENQVNESVNVSRSIVGSSFLTLDVNDPKVEYKIGIQLRKNMEVHVGDFCVFICALSHEFTHILQVEQTGVDYRAAYNENSWFNEAIAEMGCIFGLRSMADAWEQGSKFGTGLPAPDGGGWLLFSANFDNWANWYEGLESYDGTGEEWLYANEDSLRDQFKRNSKANSNYVNMDLVRQLYPKFLPIFEENPEAWNAVRKMPVTNTEKMDRYMQVWYDAVDVQDRQYVKAIAEIMGITVTSSVVPPVELASVKIDADVNDDGYVDLYDVMIVRSGMQNSVSYDTDINNDGVTDEVDLLIVKAKAMEAIAAAAPRKRKVKLTTWGEVKSR